MDLPSAFEWSTQESEVEEKEPVDKKRQWRNNQTIQLGLIEDVSALSHILSCLYRSLVKNLKEKHT